MKSQLISVVFATYRRAETLERTLSALSRLSSDSPPWGLIVADNADDPATQRILRHFESQLPLRWFVEPRRGKNFALNTALNLVAGELVVFTDDDVEPRGDWLAQLCSGSMRWPNADIFAGRILPSRDPPYPMHWQYIRGAYVIADWQQDEGPLSPGRVWGPNMAVRRRVFAQGHRFDTSIGPAGSDYVMGSETEFVKRMAKLGSEAVYLPDAVVTHQIRPEQLHWGWLCQRVYRQGRGTARETGMPEGRQIAGVPRYLWRKLIQTRIHSLGLRVCRQHDQALQRELDYWFQRGLIYEYRRIKRSEE